MEKKVRKNTLVATLPMSYSERLGITESSPMEGQWVVKGFKESFTIPEKALVPVLELWSGDDRSLEEIVKDQHQHIIDRLVDIIRIRERTKNK